MFKYFKNPFFFQRAIQSSLGFITILVVVRFLSLNTQGWYFTFSSIAAIYTLFDLGLSMVLVHLSAHLFGSLEWTNQGGVHGLMSKRFSNLVQHSVRFYGRLSLLYLLIIGPIGILFFWFKKTNFDMDIEWLFPWISFVFFNALNVLFMPLIALIEGSGSVDEVCYVRILQNLLGSLCLWGALIWGAQLWALSMMPIMSFLVVVIWLIKFKPILLRTALFKRNQYFDWKQEVWPLQWRVGLSWIAGYLLTQIYTPILFYYDSPKVAGQMGLSLTIANMLGLLAQSWIARRIPDMGKSVANKDWEKFDLVFKHDFKLSLLMYLFGSLLLCLLLILINNFSHYGNRVLSLLPFIGLLAVVLVNHINGALASHLRSYKKEPLVLVSLISTLATVPLALYGASKFSVNGVVASILIVQIVFTLPVSVFYWFKFNREWRLA